MRDRSVQLVEGRAFHPASNEKHKNSLSCVMNNSNSNKRISNFNPNEEARSDRIIIARDRLRLSEIPRLPIVASESKFLKQFPEIIRIYLII